MTVLEKLLQPVWEVSSDPIMVTDNRSNPDVRRILYVNQAFTRVNGYSKEEAIGQSATLLYGPQTDLKIVGANEEKLQDGRSQENDLLHRRKDGATYQCTVTRAPLVDVDGKSEYLISMFRVIPQPISAGALQDESETGAIPLTLPMPLYPLATTDYPQHLTSHPELDALKSLWLEVCGARVLPSRKDFDLGIMTRWASHLSIAVVRPEGRFEFRLFGTELTNAYGRDLTGCFLDELTPHDLWSVVLLHYREVVNTKRPLFAPVSVTNGRWYTEVSRLLLPLSGNGEVNFIMGADYRRDRL